MVVRSISSTEMSRFGWLNRIKEKTVMTKNPDPPRFWSGTYTVRMIAQVFDMFPLTLNGLDEAVDEKTLLRAEMCRSLSRIMQKYHQIKVTAFGAFGTIRVNPSIQRKGLSFDSWESMRSVGRSFECAEMDNIMLKRSASILESRRVELRLILNVLRITRREIMSRYQQG